MYNMLIFLFFYATVILCLLCFLTVIRTGVAIVYFSAVKEELVEIVRLLRGESRRQKVNRTAELLTELNAVMRQAGNLSRQWLQGRGFSRVKQKPFKFIGLPGRKFLTPRVYGAFSFFIFGCIMGAMLLLTEDTSGTRLQVLIVSNGCLYFLHAFCMAWLCMVCMTAAE